MVAWKGVTAVVELGSSLGVRRVIKDKLVARMSIFSCSYNLIHIDAMIYPKKNNGGEVG